MPKRTRRSACGLSMGLFGLGVPEIAVIVAVTAFVVGPQALADQARKLGENVGEFQQIPEGFKEGFEDTSSSPDTLKLAREAGQGLMSAKDSLKDMAGEYSEVASEFATGVQQGAREANKDLVGGLEETNKIVAQGRVQVKELLTTPQKPASPDTIVPEVMDKK